ncbi:unnamed protein product, partial [Mesorhabditis belari]|uniref:Elongation factor-like 1 n=1 Tax=Mesorhabditis belari TaxID=2138241 RepID=A0AAF3F8C5_9BILA
MTTFPELIEKAFASKPANEIRNVCLIAHVDHGKTTFADSLVTTNALISNRMAGKLRYMDSRSDEQERGITMKSSGVSLIYGPLLLNLIDSPGHVDFSSEVTSALLLSDIALLLVDVVEGVCSQTHTLMRQAIQNGQTIILVLNKLDRLKVELRMSSSEAYRHIVRLLEAVNSSLSQFVSGLTLEDDTWGHMEALEQRVHFEPQKGNVLFSSATHGYAFGVNEFADIWTERLKIDKSELAQHMFGDFYLSGSKIQSDAASRGKKTLFEQLVLDPLWALHECALIDMNLEKTIALAEKLGIKVKTKRLPDAFDETLRLWLPLATTCFRACARAMSALNAFKEPQRLDKILAKSDSLRESIAKCSPDGTTIAFVAKFVHFEESQLCIIRVLSGRITKGDTLYLAGKRKLAENKDEITTVIEQVYALRGREMIAVSSAVAGVICAIKATNLVPNATLCSIPIEQGLQIGSEMGEPLVRVSISVPDLDKMAALCEALRLIVLLDPSLRVIEQENGELALFTAGEVHLQKCLKDLADMGFSKLEVSSPIVPFQETVIPDPSFTFTEISQQETQSRLQNDTLHLKLRVVPLSEEVVTLLEKSNELLSEIRKNTCDGNKLLHFKEKLITAACQTLPVLKGSYWFKKSAEEITAYFDKIWGFGPEKARENILFNSIPGYEQRNAWRSDDIQLRPLDNNITTGWELFCGGGPLCHEPLRGVGLILEEWTVDETDTAAAGQLVNAMRQTCTAAMKKHPARLVAAMYKCVISTTSTALGKVHAVLAQRKAKTLSEDINEATGLFEVNAVLPVVESFDFSDHLRKRTSGMGSGQLEFSHWQIIEEDPYWVPTTQDELEEFGTKGDSINHAKGYMDAIRRRKGLPTEDLIVVSAEKQRNLKKNK